MITNYSSTRTWFDISGFGKEGKIEGMTFEELEKLSEEVDEAISNYRVENSTKEMIARFDNLMQNFNCPEGAFHHGIKCSCGTKSAKKRGEK